MIKFSNIYKLIGNNLSRIPYWLYVSGQFLYLGTNLSLQCLSGAVGSTLGFSLAMICHDKMMTYMNPLQRVQSTLIFPRATVLVIDHGLRYGFSLGIMGANYLYRGGRSLLSAVISRFSGSKNEQSTVEQVQQDPEVVSFNGPEADPLNNSVDIVGSQRTVMNTSEVKGLKIDTEADIQTYFRTELQTPPHCFLYQNKLSSAQEDSALEQITTPVVTASPTQPHASVL